MDKTNPENVQSIGQIGMTKQILKMCKRLHKLEWQKRKCILKDTFCSNVEVEGGGGFEGFYNLSYKKIKILYIKGYLKMPQTLHHPPYISNKKIRPTLLAQDRAVYDAKAIQDCGKSLIIIR